nr:hypothetical protein [Oxalobacteraceae bacterium]
MAGTSGNTLTKTGAGTLILSGDNTYVAQTNINAGTLQLGANGGGTNTPLGTTAAGTVIASGATLDLSTFTLGTAEALTINGGTLKSSSGTPTYNGAITLGASSTIDVSGTSLTIATNGITDGASSFAVTKTGTGILILGTANTYDGGTTVNAGTIYANSATSFGTGTITLGNSTGSSAVAIYANAAGSLSIDNAIALTTNAGIASGITIG